jgi:hypothetical protein
VRLFESEANRMKKRMMFLGLLFMLLLAACGGGEAKAPATPAGDRGVELPVVVETAVAEPPTLPPPQVVESGGAPTAPDAAPAMQPAVDFSAPWPTDQFGYGVQIHGNATVGDPVQTMDVVANQLGLDWVKVQIQWWLVKPSPDADQWFFYDGVVNEAHAHGLRLMLSVVGAPEWTRAAGGENGPPDDYNEYALFLTELLTRYEGEGRCH